MVFDPRLGENRRKIKVTEVRMPIYEDNTKSIGHTPLIRINRLDASSRRHRAGEDRGP